MLPRSADGVQEGTWIVADYLDVVLHVFTPDTRGFYKLEELWSDVPSIESPPPPDAVPARLWSDWHNWHTSVPGTGRG